MSGYWLQVAQLVGINSLAAVGMYLTLLTGQLSVAHGALMGVGAYVAGLLTVRVGLPYLLALGAGSVAAALAGAVVAWVTLRLKGIYFAIGTLAFGEALVVFLLNTDYVGGASGLYGIPLAARWWHPWVALALALAGVAAWERGGAGVRYRAVRDDETAARALGIDVRRVRLESFTLGAGVAGLAGGLFAHYLGILEPTKFGYVQSIQVLMFPTIGGVDHLLGGVLGAVVLTALPELLRISGQDRLMIYGAALVLAMIFRPNGLLPRGQAVRRFAAGVLPAPRAPAPRPGILAAERRAPGSPRQGAPPSRPGIPGRPADPCRPAASSPDVAGTAVAGSPAGERAQGAADGGSVGSGRNYTVEEA